MERYRKIERAIFAFHSKETGEKLRKFYKKHTRKDIDFNSIKHYKNGTKILVFSIPLGHVNPIGASAAAMCPAIKFHRGVEEFISWYEDEYLKRR